jgi:hypothetical protein
MADKPATLRDSDWLDAGKYELVGVSIRLRGRRSHPGDAVDLDEEQANRLKHVIKPAKARAKVAALPDPSASDPAQ